MMPNFNPRQMEKMMRQMGIKNETIEVDEVIMKLSNGKQLVFQSPSVQLVEAQGSKTYTVMGNPQEKESIPEADIKMVADQTNSTEEEAKNALVESEGDIVKAILKLKKE
jgi:nascent polypeptide-associated complex subunit alpha